MSHHAGSLSKTDANTQVAECVGSGPFKFVSSERLPGQRVGYEKNDKYVPRKDGKPSFNAGPKIVYIDRVVWNFIPDPATAAAALTQQEIDGGKIRPSSWCRNYDATRT